jgi:hypothetical protein
MKRITVIGISLVLGLAFPTSSYAAAKAGAACTKLNQTSGSGAAMLTCKTVSKKLVWVKTPAATQQSKYPVLKPVEGPYGITFENIVSKFNDISAAAWLDAQATIKRNQNLPSANKKVDTYISPEALKVDPLIGYAETLIKRDFALFARFPSYPKVYLVALTTAERVATQKKLLATYGKVEFINQSIDSMYGINSNSPAGSVFSAPQCTGSDSGRNIFTSTAAAVIVGVCPAIDDQRDVHFDGVHAMAHEYIHMIQSAFMPGGDYGSAAPCWMTEGEAEWGQAAVSETFSDYIKAQNFSPYRLTQEGLDYEETTAREWTTAEVITYLNGAVDPKTCYKTNLYAYSYSLGAATTEALVSIGGSESIFALHQRFMDRMPYDQAFKEVYGITWAKAVPILAEVVAKKITLSWLPTARTYQTKP